jgi:hypothetical protein
MSVEITIEGLTPRQQILADMIWACETRQQINNLIRNLPTVDLQDEAKSIVEMMIMATVEQCYDGISPMDEAKSVLDKIAKR